MFVIIDKSVVLEIVSQIEYVDGGIKTDRVIYGIPGLQVLELEEVPSDADPSKYCYTPESGFYPNPNYGPTTTPEQEISDLKDQVKVMSALLNSLLLPPL